MSEIGETPQFELDFGTVDWSKYESLLREAGVAVSTMAEFPEQRVVVGGADVFLSKHLEEGVENPRHSIRLSIKRGGKKVENIGANWVYLETSGSEKLIVGGDILNTSPQFSHFLELVGRVEDDVCQSLASHFGRTVRRRLGAANPAVESWARNRGYADDPDINGSKIPELFKEYYPENKQQDK